MNSDCLALSKRKMRLTWREKKNEITNTTAKNPIMIPANAGERMNMITATPAMVRMFLKMDTSVLVKRSDMFAV